MSEGKQEDKTQNKDKGEIYFLRHGQSLFNLGLEDKNDSPLSENGIEQAKRVFGNVDLVIVSPLKRALQTLENSKIVYKKKLISSLCREHRNSSRCDYFPWETFSPEPEQEFKNRVNEFLELLKLLSEHYPRIIVVSHHGFISKVTGKFLQNCEFVRWP